MQYQLFRISVKQHTNQAEY